jgi:hypothetical protein
VKPLSKRYSDNRRCSCSKRITNANRSGLCKSCLMRSLNADPALMKQRGETQSRILRENPYAYARKCATLARNRQCRSVESMRSAAVRLAVYRTPENEAKRVAALIEANKRRRHAWLPEQYRADYFSMLKSRGFRAAEAKAIILAQVAADKVRAEASLSPFERQERALANGARLVANDQKPSLDRPGIYEERKLA